jgi:FHA domain/zinc-ribbon domain
VSHTYCPECGYQNPESARFCAKCGTVLVPDEGGQTTEAFSAEDSTELFDTLDDLGVHGVALVVRSGGGHAGETFVQEGGRTTIGRSPECGIFLDDVTVSRKHAVLEQRDDRWLIEDLGSLNGTFVNRERVESAELGDGDEIQIGKYRLTFLQR